MHQRFARLLAMGSALAIIGFAAQAFAYQEAPQLAELVKAGKLPPVAERIASNPQVIKPVHEAGK